MQSLPASSCLTKPATRIAKPLDRALKPLVARTAQNVQVCAQDTATMSSSTLIQLRGDWPLIFFNLVAIHLRTGAPIITILSTRDEDQLVVKGGHTKPAPFGEDRFWQIKLGCCSRKMQIGYLAPLASLIVRVQAGQNLKAANAWLAWMLWQLKSLHVCAAMVESVLTRAVALNLVIE